jgi:transposase
MSTTADAGPVPPSRPKKRLTRDQRRDVLLMRGLGHTYQKIAEHLHISQRAVQYTCNIQCDTPKKAPGRTSALSSKQVDEIEDFLNRSKKNQQMTYKEIIEAMNLEINTECLRRALTKRGYRRRVALRKSSPGVENGVSPKKQKQSHSTEVGPLSVSTSFPLLCSPD